MRHPSSRAIEWAAAACFTAALVLGACGPGGAAPCASDDDCGEGAVCPELPESTGEQRTCARACTKSSDCEPGRECRCQGSILKGFCGIKVKGPVDADLCPADYDPAVACAALCECPCGNKGQCNPGPATAADCRAGCEGALTAFPACTAALTAYYECAYRHSTCVFTTNHNCLNDGSYCWGTSPEQACPGEAAAVKACASASWWLFFPTPM